MKCALLDQFELQLQTAHKKPVNGREKEMACFCRLCGVSTESSVWLSGGPALPTIWPPKFWKLQLTFETPDAQITYVYDDVRRLGRIRLVEGDPMKSPPISKLGFDPLHRIPDLREFTEMVQNRSVPVKALLLDQAFSAGVGNWLADEILWHAKIHPAHYTNALSNDECKRLRDNIDYVCRFAAEVNADSSKFPDNWLFLHRWNKGKEGKNVLPDGRKITHETVSSDLHWRLCVLRYHN
jgi:formamidopyrimidine-DNA glycosylase